MKNINISILQSNIIWEDKGQNFSMYEKYLTTVQSTTDILLLPEMFTTGFTMNAQKFAEPMNGPSMTWLKKQARATKAVLAGSLIIEDNNNYYNRLIWMQPDGKYVVYDKRHLFRMGKEHTIYTNGINTTIVQYKGWKLNLQICYDLRFPVWSRNNLKTQKNKYDILIYVANWPAKRSQHWTTLLQARAIENQAYVIGVNRVGYDGHQTYHSGNSTVIDYQGNVLWSVQDITAFHTVTLQKSPLESYRQNFPAWMDSDNFIIENAV